MPEAAEAMRPLVGERTFVVPLQNGIEAPGQLAAALGAEPGRAASAGAAGVDAHFPTARPQLPEPVLHRLPGTHSP